MTNKPYIPSITPGQCRAARGLLGWTQEKLGWEAHISMSTVQAFESERYIPHPNHVEGIKRILEERGIRFIDRGVQLVGGTSAPMNTTGRTVILGGRE